MNKNNIFIKPILDEIDVSWYPFLNNKEVIEELNKIEENIKTPFYPDTKNVLRFLKLDLYDVKYIVMGMDPYPSDYIDNKGNKKPVATGRSFEIDNFISWDTKTKNISIINIIKAIYKEITGEIKSIDEIRKEIKNGSFYLPPLKTLFDNLEKQGVLFLNYSLTVYPNKPKSNINLWHNFSTLLHDYIINENKQIKWILWGDEAINSMNDKLDDKYKIINCHPRCSDFVKNNDFSKIKNLKI